jgi:hypothetical protein
MASFYMGLKVGDKARRTPQDPRRLADDNPGQAFQSKVDKKQYVSLGIADENNKST